MNVYVCACICRHLAQKCEQRRMPACEKNASRARTHARTQVDICAVTLLLRLLSMNLRHLQRQRAGAGAGASAPTMSGAGCTLPPDLVAALRTLLLDLVGVTSVSTAWPPMALAAVQEEAVATLRAATPVLFSDPGQLLVLLEALLPTAAARRLAPESTAERGFKAMLLEYLAKPPVLWRVMKHKTNDHTDSALAAEVDLAPRDSCSSADRVARGNALDDSAEAAEAASGLSLHRGTREADAGGVGGNLLAQSFLGSGMIGVTGLADCGADMAKESAKELPGPGEGASDVGSRSVPVVDCLLRCRFILSPSFSLPPSHPLSVSFVCVYVYNLYGSMHLPIF